MTNYQMPKGVEHDVFLLAIYEDEDDELSDAERR